MVSEQTRATADDIKNYIKQHGIEYRSLFDLLDVAKVAFEKENDTEWALKVTSYIKECCTWAIQKGVEVVLMDELYWKTLKVEAPYHFESFMLYMEKNRPPEERFYEPRRNPLKQVADAIQELADDLLDELFINMPSRVGKTQIVKFAFLWWGSRNTEFSNLYTAFSDKITKGFYAGIIELINDPTYTYHEIFPDIKIEKTSGDDLTVDLVRRKTYPTFTCRSIYGTLNGACDCSGLAIADDLFSGIDEAVSVDRQATVWAKFDNNFMKRLKKKAKLINMGTRWALGDCQGRRLNLLKERPEYRNRRYKVICIPALNENEESNFDYPYDVGYSTEDYLMMRASFEENDDMASWYAQDMQSPVERLGAVFEAGTTKTFAPERDLPDREPDRIFMAIDEAFGGGDYVAAPVCYQYEDTYYIIDVVFDDGDKRVTQPLIADMILRYKVQAARFEETKTTASYRENVEEMLEDKGYRLNSYGEPAPNNIAKRNRILDKAPEIREMYFLDSKYRSKSYQKFLHNVWGYKKEGTVKHDDAPDAMAQLCVMKYGMNTKTMIIDSPIG